MAHTYKKADVSTCMPGRRVIFAGDSVTRQLFYAFAHLADPSLPSEPPKDDKKHSDYFLYTPDADIYLDFFWDPFLNSTRVKNMLSVNNADGRKPALLVLGSGLWYLRYARESGGLAAWEQTIDDTFASIRTAMPALADRVIVLPIEEPVSSKLSSERAASIHPADVDAMNSDLMHRVAALSSATSFFGPTPLPTYPIAVPSVFNKMLVPAQTQDGLHFSNSVLSQHANILFNFRCNEALPKRFPFNKTCCNSYPQTPFIQLSLLVLVIFLGPFCRFAGPALGKVLHCLSVCVSLIPMHFIVSYKPTLAAFLPSNDYFIPITIFGAVIGLNFMSDRTTIWMKEQKQFDPWMFAGLSVISMAAGIATLKSKDKDLGFLNREQTDEWKGWMQSKYLGAAACIPFPFR